MKKFEKRWLCLKPRRFQIQRVCQKNFVFFICYLSGRLFLELFANRAVYGQRFISQRRHVVCVAHIYWIPKSRSRTLWEAKWPKGIGSLSYPFIIFWFFFFKYIILLSNTEQSKKAAHTVLPSRFATKRADTLIFTQ